MLSTSSRLPSFATSADWEVKKCLATRILSLVNVSKRIHSFVSEPGWRRKKQKSKRSGKCVSLNKDRVVKPWRRKRQPTPVFLPGKSHGQRHLVGYSPWGCRIGNNWTCTRAHTHMENNTSFEKFQVKMTGKTYRSIIGIVLYSLPM